MSGSFTRAMQPRGSDALSGPIPPYMLAASDAQDEATSDDSGTDPKMSPGGSDAVRNVLGANKTAMEGALSRIKSAEAQSDALKPPEMVKPPPPPQVQATPLSERWGSLAMTMASLGGLLTRHPLTASLNAMAAVNHAYNDGDMAAAKSAYEQWKVQNENAIKMSEFQNKAYENALSKINHDYTGAVSEARVIAYAQKDNVVMALFDSGHPDDAMRVLQSRSGPAGTTQKAADAAEDIKLEHEYVNGKAAEWQTAHPDQKVVPPELILGWKGEARHLSKDDPSKEFTTAPTELEITGPDGTKRKVLADREKATGGWVTADENRTPIHADANGGFRIVPKGESEVDLSPEGLSYAATVYRRTGKLPQGYGAASAEVRTKIINMAGTESKSEGGGAATDLTEQADIHSESQALTTLARTRANITNFEDTAKREADLTLSLLDKGAGGGVPLLNRWIQAGRQTIEGDADVSSLNVALTSFKNEYARIMSAPGATGGMTTDAARSEADGLINKTMTPDQLRGAIATMKKGMQNRIDAINDAYEATRQRIRDIGPPARGKEAGVGGAASSAAGPKDGDTGKSKSGKPIIFRGGQWQYQQQ
jgi:hypothetical protein